MCEWYLWPRPPVFDLTGVQALLLGVLHAGKDPGAAETYGVDGALVVEQHPVCDDLQVFQQVLD